MAVAKQTGSSSYPAYDEALSELDAAKETWAQSSLAERIQVLGEVKDQLMTVAEAWALSAARHKQLPTGSPLVGEEWISGPYALMAGCNALMTTLSEMDGKSFLKHLPARETASGQVAVKVLPHSIWDRLLLSGVKAEVWMQPGVTRTNLDENTASAYDIPVPERKGSVALVLGAGNIAAIAPLDCFQKLFSEHQVVILKMNPVNDYLTEFLEVALKPLIDRNAIRIVKGDGAAGAYLTTHPLVEEMHITGSGATHDAIVWGPGQEGMANKKAGTPKNKRRFTSELGAVCPTIVVPGNWSHADIQFQAEHLATQKMHNSGFNCIACQVLVLPKDWSQKDALMSAVTKQIAASSRLAYYPGADGRIEEFASHADNVVRIPRKVGPACVITSAKDDEVYEHNEVFAPAMSTWEIAGTDPEAYLRAAIDYANSDLHGTLGANVLIHPKTIAEIGKQRFEEIIADLHYGTIAINGWTGLGFLVAQCPWGAFPGHTLDDVQSGIGSVHNSYMFDKPERTVIQAPWRPFPKSVLAGEMTLLPRPPWFITNGRQDRIGALLTAFQYKPGWSKLPRIFLNALLG